MNWILLALCSALFAGLRGSLIKIKARTINPYILAWSQAVFAFPLLFTSLWISQKVPITPLFLLFSITSGLLVAVAWTLYVKAISLSEISLVIPPETYLKPLKSDR